MGEKSRISRRTVLASLGVGVTALGTLPVVHQGSVDSSPLIVGHRGAAGLEPPNTVAGIRRAHELGSDGVGLDVRRTADDELVLFHDPVLDLTTDASGRVEDATLDDLQNARVDGEPPPDASGGTGSDRPDEHASLPGVETRGVRRADA